MGEQSDGTFRMSVEPRSERYDADNDQWRTQVGDMALGLQHEVGGVRRETQAVAGAKGGAEALVLALGTAGAVNAALEFLRAWIGRDRDRSLVIEWTDGDQAQRVCIEGKAIGDQAIATVAAAAARQIGGVGWTGDTAPS